ncbi:hypothetical protein B0T19DRAFT_405209 [Cercophora scortea]|uniref:Uncharacterized protein n=1 Tax=Cercophora scortea TaxID=314031 RepID=A0AAE0I3D6_9PEZI|nr:hypothetical protein B0T19DRAFT_405209 [Cercophora scortea]
MSGSTAELGPPAASGPRLPVVAGTQPYATMDQICGDRRYTRINALICDVCKAWVRITEWYQPMGGSETRPSVQTSGQPLNSSNESPALRKRKKTKESWTDSLKDLDTPRPSGEELELSSRIACGTGRANPKEEDFCPECFVANTFGEPLAYMNYRLYCDDDGLGNLRLKNDIPLQYLLGPLGRHAHFHQRFDSDATLNNKLLAENPTLGPQNWNLYRFLQVPWREVLLDCCRFSKKLMAQGKGTGHDSEPDPTPSIAPAASSSSQGQHSLPPPNPGHQQPPVSSAAAEHSGVRASGGAVPQPSDGHRDQELHNPGFRRKAYTEPPLPQTHKDRDPRWRVTLAGQRGALPPTWGTHQTKVLRRFLVNMGIIILPAPKLNRHHRLALLVNKECPLTAPALRRSLLGLDTRRLAECIAARATLQLGHPPSPTNIVLIWAIVGCPARVAMEEKGKPAALLALPGLAAATGITSPSLATSISIRGRLILANLPRGVAQQVPCLLDEVVAPLRGLKVYRNRALLGCRAPLANQCPRTLILSIGIEGKLTSGSSRGSSPQQGRSSQPPARAGSSQQSQAAAARSSSDTSMALNNNNGPSSPVAVAPEINHSINNRLNNNSINNNSNNNSINNNSPNSNNNSLNNSVNKKNSNKDPDKHPQQQTNLPSKAADMEEAHRLQVPQKAAETAVAGKIQKLPKIGINKGEVDKARDRDRGRAAGGVRLHVTSAIGAAA